jgi:hypothetical protein
MAADEERLRILRMVQDRRISTDEAAELLDALEEPGHPRERHGRPDPPSMPAAGDTRRATESANVLVKALEWGARLARRANVDLRWHLRDVDSALPAPVESGRPKLDSAKLCFHFRRNRDGY